jgi:hypothetical protein
LRRGEVRRGAAAEVRDAAAAAAEEDDDDADERGVAAAGGGVENSFTRRAGGVLDFGGCSCGCCASRGVVPLGVMVAVVDGAKPMAECPFEVFAADRIPPLPPVLELSGEAKWLTSLLLRVTDKVALRGMCLCCSCSDRGQFRNEAVGGGLSYPVPPPSFIRSSNSSQLPSLRGVSLHARTRTGVRTSGGSNGPITGVECSAVEPGSPDADAA